MIFFPQRRPPPVSPAVMIVDGKREKAPEKFPVAEGKLSKIFWKTSILPAGKKSKFSRRKKRQKK